MAFSIEAVEDKVKSAFSGRKKWLIIGAAVVGVALIVFMRKKQANTGAVQLSGYPTLPKDYAGQVGGGGGGAVAPGVSSDDLALLRDNFASQLTDLGKALGDRLAEEQARNNQNLSNLGNSLSGRISETESSFSGALSGLSSDISAQVDHSLAGAIAGIDQTVNSRLSTFAASNTPKQDAKGGSTPKVSTDTHGAAPKTPAKSSQVVYLEKLRSTGTAGEKKWANQALYVENQAAVAKATGNKGLQVWADKQKKTLGYK